MHFHTAAYCILNQFNLSPRLGTPKLRELKVLPSPLAHICLLSCFCSPKAHMEDKGMLSCTAPGAEWWGPVAKSGAWHALGNQSGLPGPAWPNRDVFPVLPLPELLQPQQLLHSGSASCRTGSCSRLGPGGVSATLSPAVPGEATASGLTDTIPPLGTTFPATPAARVPSDHHFPSCSTWEAGMAPQGLWSHCWDCCPRWCSAQGAQPFILITDGIQGWHQGLGLMYLLLEGSRKDGKWVSCSCSWCN